MVPCTFDLSTKKTLTRRPAGLARRHRKSFFRPSNARLLSNLVVGLDDQPRVKHFKNILEGSDGQISPAAEHTAELAGVHTRSMAEFLSGAKLGVDQVSEVIAIVRR